MRKSTFRSLRAAGAVIATFGLVLGLGACGSDEPDDTDEASSSSAPSASEEPADSEEPAASEDPGASEEPAAADVSDEVRAFCAEGEEFGEAEEPEGENPMAGFKEMFDNVTPPPEIKDDWEFLRSWATDNYEAFEQIDPADTEAMMNLETEMEEKYATEKVMEATETVDNFIDEHCES